MQDEYARERWAPARPWLILAVLASAALTWAAYGGVLGLPFLFDDAIHIRWMEHRTLWDAWADVRGMQHYRPLVMTVWMVCGRLYGMHNPWPQHLLTLLLHAANGAMVGWLARRTIGGWLAPLAATILFVLFPFSYQAMPSPGSLSKQLSAALVLFSVACYWRGRSRREPGWIVAACSAALLAPSAYEAAITSGGFLLLTEWLLWRRREIARPCPWALAAPLLGVPFLLAWRFVPSSYDSVGFPGWEAIGQSGVYFFQALMWPVPAVTPHILGLLGWSAPKDLNVVLTFSMPALIVAIVWRRRSAAFWAGIAWLVLAVMVQWVVLSFRYVIDGPRILYGTAPGVALLWADLLAGLAEGVGLPGGAGLQPSPGPEWYSGLRGEHRSAGPQPGGALIALLILSGMSWWALRFIGERMAFTSQGAAVLCEAAERAIEIPADSGKGSPALFINLPRWMAPPEEDFPLGHEGYTLLPPYYDVGLSDFLYANHGVRREAWMAMLPDIRQSWWAEIGYHDAPLAPDELAQRVRDAGTVWVLRYAEEGLFLVEAGEVSPGDPDGVGTPIQVLALYGPVREDNGGASQSTQVALTGIASAHAIDGGGARELTVHLNWVITRISDDPLTLFVHLYGPNGLISQADGYPLVGVYPPTAWRAGETLRDVRHIPLPDDLAPGEYTVGLGLYNSQTGERLPATTGAGERLPDETFCLPVTIP